MESTNKRFDKFFKESKHYKHGIEELKEFLRAEKAPAGMLFVFSRKEGDKEGIYGGMGHYRADDWKHFEEMAINLLSDIKTEIFNEK